MSFTPGPWFVRHCDDERFMCMTVVSSIDRGESNSGRFDNEEDTIAITYHQCLPAVCADNPEDPEDVEIREANARLIAAAPEMYRELNTMVAAAECLMNRVVETKGVKAMDDMEIAIRSARAALSRVKG